MNKYAQIIKDWWAREATKTWKVKQILLGAGALMLLAYGWYRWNLLPVSGPVSHPTAFTVASGQTTDQITGNLKKAGLIRSPRAFRTYLTLNRLRSKLKTGYYELYASDSAAKIAKVLTSGANSSKSLLVPEGFRLTEIRQRAAEKGIAPADFDAALSQSYPQAVLKERPAGASLEGYLFPDTYNVSPDTTAMSLINAMLSNFEQKVTAEHKAGFAAQGLGFHEGLTLASIVEREARLEEDRPLIAQVFLRRLRIGMKLDSDVTVQYAAGLDPQEQQKTAEQIRQLDSPYNTYRSAGLPPGPVSSPGLKAIAAVINPAKTDYLYFVADKNGKSHFARTFAEHQRNIEKYLR